MIISKKYKNYITTFDHPVCSNHNQTSRQKYYFFRGHSYIFLYQYLILSNSSLGKNYYGMSIYMFFAVNFMLHPI